MERNMSSFGNLGTFAVGFQHPSRDGDGTTSHRPALIGALNRTPVIVHARTCLRMALLTLVKGRRGRNTSSFGN